MTSITLDLPTEEALSMPLSQLLPQPSGPIPGNETIFTVKLTGAQWSAVSQVLAADRIPYKILRTGRPHWEAHYGAHW